MVDHSRLGPLQQDLCYDPQNVDALVARQNQHLDDCDDLTNKERSLTKAAGAGAGAGA